MGMKVTKVTKRIDIKSKKMEQDTSINTMETVDGLTRYSRPNQAGKQTDKERQGRPRVRRTEEARRSTRVRQTEQGLAE